MRADEHSTQQLLLLQHPADDGPLREALRQAAQQRRRYGYRRLTWLLRRQGWTDNHKRIERIYREEGLQVRRRHRERQPRLPRQPLEPATAMNQRWSMDFMADSLADHHQIRFLNLVDDFSRECLSIEADTSLPGAHRVVRILEGLRQQQGLPVFSWSSTTGRSSPVGRWISGRMRTASSWCLLNRQAPTELPTSKASTASSVTSC